MSFTLSLPGATRLKSLLTIKGPVVLKVNLANNVLELVLMPSVLSKQVALLLSHRGNIGELGQEHVYSVLFEV